MDVQALGPAPLAPSPSRSVAPSAAPVPGREDVDLGTSVPAQPLEEGLGPDADGLVAARAGPRPASLAALFGDDKEPQVRREHLAVLSGAQEAGDDASQSWGSYTPLSCGLWSLSRL